MKKKIIFVPLIMMICIGCVAESETYPLLFKSSKRLVEPYGFCSHINRIGDQWEFNGKEKDLLMMREAGADFVRTDFDWGYCQQDKEGPMSFSHHDKMMQVVDNQNIQMLGILSSPQPYDYRKWINYVAKTVGHFKNDVRYWEVINEADRWHLRYPEYTPNDYVRQLRDAYPIIKKQNKRAKVLFTSITDVQGKFFEEVLEAGVSDCFDIMNFHFYVNNNTEPEYLLKYFKDCQNILEKYKIQKPVWFTETGCTTAPGYADEEIQAKRLPRVFLISFASGIEKVFWYKSRAAERSDQFEEHFGLWHKDYTPKPAFYAYKTLTRMCPSKSTRPQIQRKGNVYIATWKQPNGKKVSAIWTSRSIEKIGVANVPQKIFDYLGNEVKVLDTTIVVSPMVQYCFGNFTVK